MTYYTLASREGNAWFPQFGDYERDVVYQERQDQIESGEYRARDLRVVKSGDGQEEIAAAVSSLNDRVS